jgi:hypothetical protein
LPAGQSHNGWPADVSEEDALALVVDDRLGPADGYGKIVMSRRFAPAGAA